MKYVLIIGVVLVVYWLWRSTRQVGTSNKKQTRASQKPVALEEATEIVACQVCQVHLPRNEALIGTNGLYCSAEHRLQAGD